MTVVENKWLQGPYAPIAGDVTATELTVEGTLPAELEGRYLRNGPNPIGPVDPATHHWFTGDGMVHGVRLGDGRADWYRARMVRSTAVSEALGEEPAPGERHGGFDTANTNVIGLGGKTFAIVEAGARPVELSYELDTICHTDLDGTLPHGYTAHPKVDPATGDLHAIAYHWAIPHLEYIVIGRRRPREAGVAGGGRRRPDGPRLLDHRALGGRLRPPGDLRPRRRDERGAVPLRLERRPSRRGSASSRSAAPGRTCGGSRSRRATRSTR